MCVCVCVCVWCVVCGVCAWVLVLLKLIKPFYKSTQAMDDPSVPRNDVKKYLKEAIEYVLHYTHPHIHVLYNKLVKPHV